MVPRQGIMLAVFHVEPIINIKFLSEFWVQTAEISGCRPFDHILTISEFGEIFADQWVPWSRLDDPTR